MTPTRREFIKSVGIAVAALVACRCDLPFRDGDDGDTPRARLRRDWSRFDWLAEEVSDWDNHERGEEARDELVADHRAALDALVAAGELEEAVADQVQEGFAAAAYHVWRANCGMTCYEPMAGPDYTPGSSNRLAQQAELLAEMADDGDIDQVTVAQAQAAIERDIVFLNLSGAELEALYDELVEAAGDSYHYPPFDELDLEITPEAAAAARFLVELLLEE
jgi:hypothetical protein